MQKISSDTLQNQIQKLLVQLSASVAAKNDLIFDKMRKDADSAAGYAENVFSNPIPFSNSNWKFYDHMSKGVNGQYLNHKDELSSIFIPNHVVIDDELKTMIESSNYLNFLFPRVIKNDLNEVAIWMVGQTDPSKHFSMYYPNIDLGTIASPDEKTTEQIFYSVANPQNNPEKIVVWTPVYDDPAEQGLMITASAPLYTQKGFSGVLGIDITLNTIRKNIEEYNPIEGSYFFLLDGQGRAIALPEQAYLDILGRSPIKDEFGTDLNAVANNFAPIIQKMKKGLSGFEEITSGTKKLYIAYTPLKGVGFSIGAVVDKSIALKSMDVMQTELRSSLIKTIFFTYAPSGIIILIITIILAFLFSQSISKSLTKLRDATIEIGKGNLDTEIEINMHDEIGELAKSFKKMTTDLKESESKLKDYSKTLEEKVEKRTLELEAKNKQQEEVNLELKNTNEMMIGREVKMADLKNEIMTLKKKLDLGN